jgi:hypothetical protein
MISRVFSKKGPRPQPSAEAAQSAQAAEAAHAAATAASFAMSSELSTSDIENYYSRIILECLRRMLVPADSMELRVARSRFRPGKLQSYVGYVRILKWDPLVTPVLLQNLPVIDARVRKMANASVILEHTHFAGLWFQATSATLGSPKTLVGLPLEMIHQPGRASDRPQSAPAELSE